MIKSYEQKEQWSRYAASAMQALLSSESFASPRVIGICAELADGMMEEQEKRFIEPVHKYLKEGK